MLHDRPNTPLALETFINVVDPRQHADFASLAQKREIEMLFCDEHLRYRLAKRVTNMQGEQAPLVLRYGGRLVAAIPEELRGFDAAKTAAARGAEWSPRGEVGRSS